MKPHKHAEVIKAWADGAEIQSRIHNSGWVDCSAPHWYEGSEYRVKPEPPIVVEEHVYFSDLHGYPVFKKQFPVNIRFTFDPKTMNPIKVELI